jgi:hypothetical protein
MLVSLKTSPACAESLWKGEVNVDPGDGIQLRCLSDALTLESTSISALNTLC